MATRRFDIRPKSPARHSLLVAVGDLVVLASFVAYGLLAHSIYPLEYPQHAMMTGLPFVIAWGIVAPLGGLYRRQTLESVRSVCFRVVSVWGVVTLVGGGIRASEFFHGDAPPIFLLTTFVFGLAFLLPWRFAVALLVGRSSSA